MNSMTDIQVGTKLALQFKTTSILLDTILKIVQTGNYHDGYAVHTSQGHSCMPSGTSPMEWHSL
jgi:hypothetical protein